MMKIVRNEDDATLQSEIVADVDGKMVSSEELLAALESNTNKPSAEEIAAAELEYQEISNEFSAKDYAIGDIEHADDVYKFFINYIENHVMWTKNGWMGVIKLNDEITQKYEEFKKNPELPFTLGYQALEFTMFMLSNPGGIGLNSAKAIELMSDLYIFIMEEVSNKLDGARAQLKDIQFAYDRWISMQQGFYLEREDALELPEDLEKEVDNVENNITVALENVEI